MEFIYLVIIFVFIMLDVAVLLVGGYLLPFVFGCFSFVIAAASLQPDIAVNIPYHPYLQLALVVVAIVCWAKSLVLYRNP